MPDLPEHQPATPVAPPATNRVTPAWLIADPCPSWCEGDHPEAEHPEDRAHLAAVHVPVVRPCRPHFDAGGDQAEAAEYIVVMRRYAGQPETWVYIGDGENTSRAIEVTAESAQRLITEAARLVGHAFA